MLLTKGGEEEEVVPLPNVDLKIYKMILEYCNHHKDDRVEREEEQERRSEDMCDWDMQFINVDVPTLQSLTQAANYLDIPKLLTVCCKAYANLIKGKSADAIRTTFTIKERFRENLDSGDASGGDS